MSGLTSLLENEPSPEEARAFLGQYHLPPGRTVIKNLQSIAAWASPSEEAEAFLIKLLDHIRDSAHPEQALNQAERFFCGIKEPDKIFQSFLQNKHSLRILCTLFGASPFLSGILVQDPGLFSWLVQERVWNAPLEREALIQEILSACREIPELQKAYPVLRRIKRREILRIGARDLTGFSDFTETTRSLTILAEAALEAAYQVADRFMKMRYGTPLMEENSGMLRECRFAVLAMGKLGGSELNFSSDIDLLYLYESDKGETTGVSDASGGIQGKMGSHLYFVRLCEALTDMLHANTEDGFVFRVDLRLRPEGTHGPVASSLRTYELYYESFGQTWERAALMKCRPVAGDLALGREFENMVRPFVYRKYLDYAAIDEIKEMKKKILKELGQRPLRGDNIKLGHGGIREIEFFIQALQLIYGGRITWIRERSSLLALHRLCDKELITYEDFSALSRAYLFLRDVEHKLQIENQIQLQTLPTDLSRLEQLARRCGYPDLQDFLQDLDDHRSRVQGLFENLFYEKEREFGEEDSPLHAILGEELEPGEAHRHLLSLGFQNPHLAYKNIMLLKEGPPYAHTSSRCRALFWKIAPDLLKKVASSPDPDMALNNMERFISVYGAREVFYGLLGETPRFLQKIVFLFSMSSYLSSLLVLHPDTIEVLFGEDLMRPEPPSEALFETLMQGMKKISSSSAKMDFLRRFKHLEEMKIGLRDILMDTDLLETSSALSRLADACLETAHALAREELAKIYGSPRNPLGEDAGFAVMGAGKLGSGELVYGSDLDLIFVYSENGECSGPGKITNMDFFTRLAGRTAAILSTMTAEGMGYRVDLRLRPQGEAGPLVQSLQGFREYLDRSIQPWERQALTRVRFCAGDKKTGERLNTLITETLFHAPPVPELRQNILDMRMKIEHEKARQSEALLFFKTGAGGLIDIEFLVQYLQLRHGHENPEIRSPGTLRILETARGLGFLSEEDAASLKASYLFLSRLESRIRIVQDRPITSLSSDPGKNRALALRMGYANTDTTTPGRMLLDDYHAVTQKTREVFLRLLGAQE